MKTQRFTQKARELKNQPANGSENAAKLIEEIIQELKDGLEEQLPYKL